MICTLCSRAHCLSLFRSDFSSSGRALHAYMTLSHIQNRQHQFELAVWSEVGLLARMAVLLLLVFPSPPLTPMP